MNHTCYDCHTEIPTGLAVRRSISFRQVAYHRDCWRRLHPLPVPAIPAQRTAPPRTLMQRLLALS